jgi:hypothetical protein
MPAPASYSSTARTLGGDERAPRRGSSAEGRALLDYGEGRTRYQDGSASTIMAAITIVAFTGCFLLATALILIYALLF